LTELRTDAAATPTLLASLDDSALHMPATDVDRAV